MDSITVLSEQRCAGGILRRISHESKCTTTSMTFNIFVPSSCEGSSEVPLLYYLSGITCTDENFSMKGGAYEHAAKEGLVLVAPDTSPRDAGIPGEDDSWDMGTGAGFYVDATSSPWAGKYNMYSYVTEELPALLYDTYPFLSRTAVGVFGHSMGGHGALILSFRNPDKYKSVSAFAPIVSPSESDFGKTCFSAYLESKDEWAAYDSVQLMNSKGPFPFDDILIGNE